LVGREERALAVRQEVSFHYQMAEMKARKIVTLIKFSKLNYLVEEVTDTEAKPFLLRSPQGELTDEYEIIAYIVNDSFLTCYRDSLREASLTDSSEAEESIDNRAVSLCGSDILLWAKMNERLFELRRSLFPLLEEFYRYLFGHERVRKSRYDALLGRIKKEILKLDQLMAESGDLFSTDCSFLSIIIASEMFVACKFVFEEKFRKSKWVLFNKCEKIAKRPEFEDVYGKASFCVKECLPVEFEEEEEPEAKKLEEAIPLEIVKLVEAPALAFPCNEKRNELLFNFFRSTLKGQESKTAYFPYFWLMYDNLLCSLVELHFAPDKDFSFQELEKHMTLALQTLPRVLKPIDYGFLGVYLNEKERHHRLQGLLCLASHNFEELNEELAKHGDLRCFKALRVDIGSEDERRKVEMLWENQT
jgi:hypothetical protein